MCRLPQGPLFFGKKPQLFPLSPYLHSCIIPYYRAFGQSVFSKSGSKRAKKPPKAKEKPLPSQLPSLGKIHSFPPGLSEKIPGTQRFRGFSSVLAGFGPCPLFSCNTFFLGAKVLLWAFPETKFCPCARSSAEAPVNLDRQFGPPGHRFPVYPCMFLNPVKAQDSLQGAALSIM